MSTVLAKSRGVLLQTLEICLRQQKVLLCEPALSVLCNISPKEKSFLISVVDKIITF